MRFVIVGAVAGGAACATRLRRLFEDAEIILIEKTAYPSFANCALPYYLGDRGIPREALFAATAEELRGRHKLDLRLSSEAVAIDPGRRELTVRSGCRTEAVPYDVLILATGARADLPAFLADLEGVFSLRTVPDAEAVKRVLDQGRARSALVLGGGFIGLETAENLRRRGLEVTLIEREAQLLGDFDFEMARFLEPELKSHGVGLALSTRIAAARSAGGPVILRSADGREFTADLAVCGTGIRPNSEIAREAGLKLDERGFILTDARMRTSCEGIYALGDVAAVRHRVTGRSVSLALAGPISKQVRALTGHLTGRERPFEGVLGARACRIFDLEAAAVGLSERALKAAGLGGFSSVWTHSLSTPGFYPGSSPVHLKLTFDNQTGRILGAQAAGARDAVRAVDVISAVMGAGGTVDDLVSHEQAYAPPVGAARDPVGLAGAVAQNARDGLFRIARFDELDSVFRDAFILDVRPAAAFSAGHLPRAVNIPLNELRARAAEVPRGRTTVCVCRVGQTAYYAARILAGLGREDVYVLSGSQLTVEAAGGARAQS